MACVPTVRSVWVVYVWTEAVAGARTRGRWRRHRRFNLYIDARCECLVTLAGWRTDIRSEPARSQ